MNLEQVFAQVPATEKLGYVRDDKIHYLVLNGPDDNVWNYKTIARLNDILDEVSATEGEGVFVTVAPERKCFSTGFDIEWWMKKPTHSIGSTAAF